MLYLIFVFAILYQTGADRYASCSGGCLARMLRNEGGINWNVTTSYMGRGGEGLKMAIFSVTYFLNDPYRFYR